MAAPHKRCRNFPSYQCISKEVDAAGKTEEREERWEEGNTEEERIKSKGEILVSEYF